MLDWRQYRSGSQSTNQKLGEKKRKTSEYQWISEVFLFLLHRIKRQMQHNELTIKFGTDETAVSFKGVTEWCCHLLSSYCIADKRLNKDCWWNGTSGNKSSTQRKTSLGPLGTPQIPNRSIWDLTSFFKATDELQTGWAVAELWRMRRQLEVWMIFTS
jgi:hypothetical protein